MTERDVSADREQYGRELEDFPTAIRAAVRGSAAVPLDVASDAVTLWRLAQLRAAVEQAMSREVAYRRVGGVAWADLAVALGVTPQAAQQRYRSVAPVVRRRAGAGT